MKNMGYQDIPQSYFQILGSSLAIDCVIKLLYKKMKFYILILF